MSFRNAICALLLGTASLPGSAGAQSIPRDRPLATPIPPLPVATSPLTPGAAAEAVPSAPPALAAERDAIRVTIRADEAGEDLFPVMMAIEPDRPCPTSGATHLDRRWLASCLGGGAAAIDASGAIMMDRADLAAGIQRVNVILFEQGYLNSGLIAPAIDSVSAAIELRLVVGAIGAGEGSAFAACRLERPEARNRLTHRFLEHRLMQGCRPGQPFNAYLLERNFRRLADKVEPWIDRINAQVTPAGTGRARLVGVEAEPLAGGGAADFVVTEPLVSAQAGVANNRPPSVGSVRAFAAMTLRGPAGLMIDAEAGSTEGAFDGAGALTLSLAPRWSLTLRGDVNNAEIIDPVLRPLDIRSRGWGGEAVLSFGAIRCPLTPLFGDPFLAGGNQPPRRAFASNGLESCPLAARLAGDVPVGWSAARDVEVALTLSHRVSKSYLLGQPFSFSPGSVDGRSQVTALRGTLSWLERGRAGAGGERGWTLAALLRASVGLDGSASDIAGLASPSRHFFVVSAQLGYARQLPLWQLDFTARAAGQWTDGLLYTAERFAIGGSQSVRGYPEAVLLADRGLVASVELGRVLSLSKGRNNGGLSRFDPLRFRLALFADGAIAANLNPGNRATDVLGAVGVGLAWIPSEAIELRADYGLRLGRDLAGPDRSLASHGFHFRLTVDPLRLLRGRR